MVNGVHRRDDGEEDLSGADVARRFVAADMLLAGLHREAVTEPSVRIVRNADETAGHMTLVSVARGEVGGMRTAEAERHAKTLRATDSYVGAKFARRLQE